MAAHPHWQMAAECDSADTARTALAASPVDVLFLDIQMPRESGLTLARELSCLAAPPLIIFITAFNEHAVDAFEVHALDYLLKPIDDQRLAQAIARADAMLSYRQSDGYRAALRHYTQTPPAPTPELLNVRSVGSIEQIRLQDVLWPAIGGQLCRAASGRQDAAASHAPEPSGANAATTGIRARAPHHHRTARSDPAFIP